MELWKYYRILRRRKWLIVLGMAMCVILVAIYNAKTEPTFVGRATVMERQPAERGVPVYGDPYMGQANLEIHLADLGNICMSQKVMNRTHNTLKLFNISVDPLQLLRTVKVEPLPDTQILKIDVISSNPEEAKTAADVLAAEFQRAYGEIMHEPTLKSREFIEDQLPGALRDLEKIRSKVRQFKEQSGIIFLSQQSEIAVRKASEYRDQLASNEIEKSQAMAEKAVTEKYLSDVPEWRESARQVAQNPIYMDLARQLNQAEVDLATHLETRGEEYPAVKALRERIADIKNKLNSPDMTEMKLSSENTMVHPLRDGLRDKYLSANTRVVAASAREQHLVERVAQAEADMKKLPAEEKELAQLLVDQEAAEQTYRLLRMKLNEAKIKESESKNASAIKVIDDAYVFPVDQKKQLKLGLALLLSPMLSAAIVFLLYYLDNTIKTPAEAEDLLGLPIAAVVPGTRAHSLVRHKNSAALGETYQILSTNLWSNLDVAEGACILVASAEPDTGRSVTASNLAVTLASDGARVILVDADLRQPVQHLLFGVSNKYGLTNVLSGAALVEDVLRPTKFDGLLLMTAGPIPENPVRLLHSPEMKAFVEHLSSVADFVIFDSPAGIAFADSALIASYAKNVLIVHSAGKIPRGAEAEFRARLEQFGVNLIGAVLNMVHPDDSHGYFHYRQAYQDILPPSGKQRQLVGAGSPKAIAKDTAPFDSRES